MKVLIEFEFRKIRKSKKTLAVLGIFLLLLLLYFVVNEGLDRQKAASVQENYRTELQSVEKSVEDVEDAFSGKTMPDTAVRVLEETKTEQKLLTQVIAAHQAGDWKSELKINIVRDQNLLKEIDGGHTITEESKENVQERMQLNQTLYQLNIPPLRSDNEMSGYHFLYLFFNALFPMLVPFVLLALVADSIPSEKDWGTAAFLLQQPIPRSRIYFSKWIANLLCSVALLCASLLAALLLAGVYNGMGSAAYPVRCSIGGTIGFLPISRVILQAAALSLLFLVFLTAFAFFVATLSPNSVSAICICLLTYGIFAYFNTVLSRAPGRFWNPFFYNDPISLLTQVDSPPLWMGSAVLIGFSVLLLFIGRQVFRKREFC